MYYDEVEAVATVIATVAENPLIRRALRKGAVWTFANIYKVGDALSGRRRS
ncbi:MAG TPA: hypothetical protein VGO93_20590 [Candidatus Xenobia bacterium]|jgi:hypothetical protein